MQSTAITKKQISQGTSNENNNGILRQHNQVANNMDNINVKLLNPVQKTKNPYSYYPGGQ